MNFLYKNQSMLIPNNVSTIRAAMADEECIVSSTGITSASASNWWPENHQHVHATSLPSWIINSPSPNWNIQNPNSSYSSGEEDLSMSTSFTNASDHSTQQGVPGNELIGENPSDNHLWKHVLLSVGNNEELHNNQDVGDDLIEAFSSKNLSNGLFEPACDYLKKMDNGWDIPDSAPFSNSNGFSYSMFEAERLTKSANLVGNWSIAPPDPEMNSSQFNSLSCNISLSSTLDQYSNSPNDASYTKPSAVNGTLNRSYSPHDLKLEKEQTQTETNANLLRRMSDSNGTRYQTEMDNALIGDDNKFYNGIPDIQCNTGREFKHVPFFSNFLSKPWINMEKPILKSLNISDCKKQAILQDSQTPTISTCNTPTRSNRKGHLLANEGKKKRSEEQSGTVLKKPKHESSIVSSAKVPKAKLGGKITALQQIVSPFGKTDTASVLWEAINYIKFLQEQVQLLSNPYRKTTMKEPWGGMDRKERGHIELVDLKSRGLCLVPVSFTPQVYRENTGPDYLTPAYRGCLYR